MGEEVGGIDPGIVQWRMRSGEGYLFPVLFIIGVNDSNFLYHDVYNRHSCSMQINEGFRSDKETKFSPEAIIS